MEKLNLLGFLLMFYGLVMLLKVDHFKKAIIRWGAVFLLGLTLIIAVAYFIVVATIIGIVSAMYWLLCKLFRCERYWYELKVSLESSFRKAWEIFPNLKRHLNRSFKYTK